MQQHLGNTAFHWPTGFLWGAATAAHQVEGGNRWNDWWELEQAGRLPHQSGEACRHYELFESDFDLAQSLGHNAHRFSIEWSRIEPQYGEWSDPAIEHYIAVVDALRARGIEPVVTLHHFTNPGWFGRRGGWTRKDSVALFSRYVDRVARSMTGKVRFWITINEPTVFVKRAYVTGAWPPCTSRSWRKAVLALWNLYRAHSAAYRVLHSRMPNAMVGIAHSAPFVVPCNERSLADRLAAWARDLVLNRACFWLLGCPLRKVADFIGLNYYSRQVVSWRPASGAAMLFGTECKADHHGDAREYSSLGWEVFAPGLRQVLLRFMRHGLPLMVTENGIATEDEALRTRFVHKHVLAIAEALQSGAQVLGYLYWTLMDNYEWTEGRTAKFGLAATDFLTQQRTPRPAAWAFKALIDRRGDYPRARQRWPMKETQR